MIDVDAQPFPFPLDPAHVALVVIDMQRDFLEPGGFGETLGNDLTPVQKSCPRSPRCWPCFAPDAGRFFTRARTMRPISRIARRLSVCAARLRCASAIPGPMGRILIRGEPGADIVPELAPARGEIVVDKPGKGMFYATDIGDRLKAMSIKQLVFAGVTTEVCVQTSMREANDRGYECLSYRGRDRLVLPRLQTGGDRDDPRARRNRRLDGAAWRVADSGRVSEPSRWGARSPAKTPARRRVWESLVQEGVNVGPVLDRIPNFVGADAAAKRLSELAAWRRARVVKCNPDPPQIPLRLRALYDGKLLFSPVPYLTKGFPYLRIDPEKLVAQGVDFETAATSQGFLAHGEPVGFEDMPKLDFCVVGCVAVTRRGRTNRQGRGLR